MATVRAAHAAEQKLSEHGVTPQQLTDALTEGAEVARKEVARTTRRTRRKLARRARRMRREMARTAARTRRQAAVARQVEGAKLSARQLGRETRQSLKVAGKTAKKQAAKKQAATKKAAKASARRRRWPWLFVAAAFAGVAYALRSKSEQAARSMPEQRDADHPPLEGEETLHAKQQRNGQHVPESTTSEHRRR